MTDSNPWPVTLHVHCTAADTRKYGGLVSPLERAIAREIKLALSSPYIVQCHVLLSGHVAIKLAPSYTGRVSGRHYHAYYTLDDAGQKWNYKHVAFHGALDVPVKTMLTLHRVVRPPTPKVKLEYGTGKSPITYPSHNRT